MTMVRWLRRTGWRRLLRVVGVVAVLLVPFGVAALGHGNPVTRVPMSGGGAWLVSVNQGLVTLIDGASEQVVGSRPAPGAAPGDALSVVQSGTSAYVVDASLGTVSRLDGATYESTPAVRFGLPGGPLGVYAAGPTVFVVDGARGLLSDVDRVTLHRRAEVSLAARPGPGQSVVDRFGRLWVVDGTGRGLVRVTGAAKLSRPAQGDERSRLVVVRGEPVLVDVSRGRLGRLSGDAEVDRWSCLDVRGSQVQVLGSAHSDRVYAAVGDTGTLVVSSVDRDDCSMAVPIGASGDRFGAIVEVQNFVLVPNRSTGRTVVVDVSAGRKVADLRVAEPNAQLELVAQDRFVFYNDLGGDRAGVIRLDGGTWRVGKALRKFGAPGGGTGLLTPGGDSVTTTPSAEPSPGPSRSPESPPTSAPGTSDNGPDLPRRPDPQPSGPQPSGGNGGTDSTTPTVFPSPTSPSPTVSPVVKEVPVIRDIAWSDAQPIHYDEPVTFTGAVDNAAGAAWTWTVTDAGGTIVQTSTAVGGFTFTPRVENGRDLTVTLAVRTPFGAATPRSEQFTAQTSSAPHVTNLRMEPGTAVVGEPVRLLADEAVAGDRATWRWQIRNLDTSVLVTGPTDAPPGAPLPFTFAEAGRYQVRLVVDHQGTSDEATLEVTVGRRVTLRANITGTHPGELFLDGTSCGHSCSKQYLTGTTVTLRVDPEAGTTVKQWTGCTASGDTCTVTLDRDTDVTVDLDGTKSIPHPRAPAPRLSGGGQTVSVGSGTRRVNLRNNHTSVSLMATATETGTDDGSAIGTMEIWASLSFECRSSSGVIETTSDRLLLIMTTRATVSRVFDFNSWEKCRDTFWTQMSASATFTVLARSKGGPSAVTDALIVGYYRS